MQCAIMHGFIMEGHNDNNNNNNNYIVSEKKISKEQYVYIDILWEVQETNTVTH